MIMEYVSRPNLNDYIEAHGPMSVNHALNILQLLAEALQYANENGIIHRDIKVENILLEPVTQVNNGFSFSPKIADLGSPASKILT